MYSETKKRKAREYSQKYYQKNKKKVLEKSKVYNKAYRQKPENREKRKKYLSKHEVKERSRQRTARWRKNHPDYNKHQRTMYKKSNTERRATAKRYFQANREKMLKYQLVRYYELRNIVLEGYSKSIPKCVCCGVKGSEFLAIDHIKGRREMDSEPELKNIGYSSKLNSKKFYVWLRNNNFPKGFQILCHNCNFAKGKLGKCPHQK